MFICIHRGGEEIGGNCVEVRTAQSKILIDLGQPLDWNERSTKEQLKIRKRARKWLKSSDAVFISHAHADHYGLLSELNGDIPVFMSLETRVLLLSNPFNSIDWEKINIQVLPIREEFAFRDFKVTAYHIDHSVFGACSFLFQTEGKTVLYSGDLRLHGRKGELYRLLPRHPDYLLLEGTNVDSDVECVRESLLTAAFASEFRQYPEHLHTVWCSSMNVDRIVSLYKACRETGKILAVDPHTAFILGQISLLNPRIPHLGKFNDLKVYFPQRLTGLLLQKDPEKYTLNLNPRQNKITYDDICSSPGKYVLMVRSSAQDFLDRIASQKIKMRFTLSNWSGYWDEPKMEKFRNFIEENCSRTPDIHTSGHADLQSLRLIIQYLSPSVVIPLHTSAADSYKERLKMDQKVQVLKNEEIFYLE